MYEKKLGMEKNPFNKKGNKGTNQWIIESNQMIS